MNCGRNNRCGNNVGGTTTYPCQRQLLALEECLKGLEVVPPRPPRPRPCRCRCCCCCCCCRNWGNTGGNQTTWGR